jgi:hypothetical protein
MENKKFLKIGHSITTESISPTIYSFLTNYVSNVNRGYPHKQGLNRGTKLAFLNIVPRKVKTTGELLQGERELGTSWNGRF